MDEEKKEEVKANVPAQPQKSSSNLTEKVRGNPWVVSTFILGALVVILLVTTFSGNLTGNVISKDKAASNLVSFLDTNINSNITLLNVSEQAGLYVVTVGYQGQAIPVYVTKDGTSYTTSLIPMAIANTNSNTNTNTQQATIPKTDLPAVELYVFAYCPYGLQMEKAMIPVAQLMADKINFTVRYIGDMHDPSGCTGTACFEKTETQRQLCIEKYYPDQYLNYLLAFADDTTCPTGSADCVATKTNALFTKFGIDASKINSCMTSEGTNLFAAEVANANSQGIGGSPTVLINGIEAQPSSRSPEAVKGSICNAFTTVPTQCSQKLDTTSASAGFGTSGSSSTGSASCGTPTA